MNLFKNLAEIYDKLIEDGVSFNDGFIPIGFSTAEAGFEITIDEDSNFIGARTLEKKTDNTTTLIPVTEESQNRTGQSAPHLLFDNLMYVAKDAKNYSYYSKTKNKNVNISETYNLDYIAQLKDITVFSGNEKIKILFNFLTKENLIKTLIDNNVLTLDENGILDESEVKKLARFKILNKDKEYFLFDEKEIIDLFFNYYVKNDEGIVDFDYNTGIKGVCGEKFPSKIRNTSDKAKIFSANDTSGYTFRGQFKDAKEARSINHVISDKAHNALKYLIKKQGFRQDDKVILIFGNVESFKVNDIINNDTFSFLGIEEIPKYDSYSEYADFIRKNFLGIKNNLFNEKIPEDLFLDILILDTMVPGRLSINFFKEYRGITELENFIGNIQEWYLSTNWYAHKKISDNKSISYYTNVSIFDIVKSTYGFEGQTGLSFRNDDKIVKKTITDIFKLVINNRKIDYRIVQLLTNKAKKPSSYNNHYNWEKVLKTACAVNRKYYNEKFKKEEIPLTMEGKTFEINYELGRLLAIEHLIEHSVTHNNETNAKKYFTKFFDNPEKTAVILREKILPYEKKLKSNNLLKIRQEIMSNLDSEEFKNIRKLDGRALCGFDAQISEYFKQFNNTEVEKDE